MKIEILAQKYNPLLKRKELAFEFDHSQEGQTLSRLELKKHLANVLKAKIDLIILQKMETKTGTMTAIVKANVYESPEQVEFVEPKHIIARNTPARPSEAEKPSAKETEITEPISEMPEKAKPTEHDSALKPKKEIEE